MSRDKIIKEKAFALAGLSSSGVEYETKRGNLSSSGKVIIGKTGRLKTEEEHYVTHMDDCGAGQSNTSFFSV